MMKNHIFYRMGPKDLSDCIDLGADKLIKIKNDVNDARIFCFPAEYCKRLAKFQGMKRLLDSKNDNEQIQLFPVRDLYYELHVISDFIDRFIFLLFLKRIFCIIIRLW